MNQLVGWVIILFLFLVAGSITEHSRINLNKQII